ncbi:MULTISPECIES: DUF2231 domain-containing protein [Echinicola]|nr:MULTISPECIES: DUF2231 domain-containing protein [Echinicola]AWW29463.1 hypothetical protein DN752_04520 [Echinicola strongylocentroti]GGF42373.1 hypothetical protein GCM10011339_33560 [Echinicola rosea]
MGDIPSIWRTETWHPLSVHFPIAFLLLATLVCLVIYFASGEQRKFLQYCRAGLLMIGTVTIWIAIYTGSLAYNVVVRKICDPQMLGEHQWYAYASAITYSTAMFTEWVLYLKIISKNKLLVHAITILLIIGAFGLGYAGHLGASVVYQQGAGVYQPTEDCVEFNE